MRVHDLDVDLIDSNPTNPAGRTDDVADLATSIQALGLLAPIVVVNRGDGYTVISGHRRLAAVRSLGWKTVPVVLRPEDTVEDAAVVAAGLADNVARLDLNPVDEAEGYDQLVVLGWSQRRIAETVGRSQAHVSKCLKVLSLPTAIVERVRSGELPFHDAYKLASTPQGTKKEPDGRWTPEGALSGRIAVVKAVAHTVAGMAERFDNPARLARAAELLEEAAAELELAIGEEPKPRKRLACTLCDKPLAEHGVNEHADLLRRGA